MNNVPLKSQSDDELYFHDILRIIKESKKLLICSIVIFTILAILYSQTLKPSFKSSALLRIGYIEMTSGESRLFESPDELAQNIKIKLIIQYLDTFENHNSVLKNFKFTPIEEKLLHIEIISNSQENNQKIIDNIITHTIERHLKLKVRREFLLEKLSNSIKKIDQEIEFVDNQLLKRNLFITESNEKSNAESDNLFENYAYVFANEERIFKLAKEREILENELLDMELQTIFQTEIVNGIDTKTIKPKTLVVISLGIIIGLFTGILLVFINYFLKSYRER